MVTAEVKGGSAYPQQFTGLWGIRSDLKIYLRGNAHVGGDTGMSHDHKTTLWEPINVTCSTQGSPFCFKGKGK